MEPFRPVSRSPRVNQFCYVGFRIIFEFVVSMPILFSILFYILLGPLFLGSRFFDSDRDVFVLTAVVFSGTSVLLVWVLYRRYKSRLATWRAFSEWSENPVGWDGSSISQLTPSPGTGAKIDPTNRFRVAWDCFGKGHGLYTITQGNEKIRISTQDPQAECLLVEVLRVKNYPCKAWPNLDI